jgi:hypothetical protein
VDVWWSLDRGDAVVVAMITLMGRSVKPGSRAVVRLEGGRGKRERGKVESVGLTDLC